MFLLLAPDLAGVALAKGGLQLAPGLDHVGVVTEGFALADVVLLQVDTGLVDHGQLGVGRRANLDHIEDILFNQLSDGFGLLLHQDLVGVITLERLVKLIQLLFPFLCEFSLLGLSNRLFVPEFSDKVIDPSVTRGNLIRGDQTMDQVGHCLVVVGCPFLQWYLAHYW